MLISPYYFDDGQTEVKETFRGCDVKAILSFGAKNTRHGSRFMHDVGTIAKGVSRSPQIKVPPSQVFPANVVARRIYLNLSLTTVEVLG